MHPPRTLGPLLGTALAAALTACAADDEPKKPAAPPVVLLDAAGKEHKVTGWKITAGTRRLGWLAADDPAPAPKDPAPPKGGKFPAKRAAAGPEALEFREDNSTTFVDGILTLVPLERVRTVRYDKDKKTVTVTAATGAKDGGATATLTGTTRFKGINKLVIEAEVDKGDLGVAEIKFLGGVDNGLQAITFPDAAAAPVEFGRPAKVTAQDKMAKEPHPVHDLQALYRTADGREVLSPTLLFKKTLKVDVAKVTRLTAATGGDPDGLTFAVALQDGGEETLTLLKAGKLGDRDVELEGLLGRVAVGYKLFPLHTVAEVKFEEK